MLQRLCQRQLPSSSHLQAAPHTQRPKSVAPLASSPGLYIAKFKQSRAVSWGSTCSTTGAAMRQRRQRATLVPNSQATGAARRDQGRHTAGQDVGGGPRPRHELKSRMWDGTLLPQKVVPSHGGLRTAPFSRTSANTVRLPNVHYWKHICNSLSRDIAPRNKSLLPSLKYVNEQLIQKGGFRKKEKNLVLWIHVKKVRF